MFAGFLPRRLPPLIILITYYCICLLAPPGLLDFSTLLMYSTLGPILNSRPPLSLAHMPGHMIVCPNPFIACLCKYRACRARLDAPCHRSLLLTGKVNGTYPYLNPIDRVPLANIILAIEPPNSPPPGVCMFIEISSESHARPTNRWLGFEHKGQNTPSLNN